MAGNVSEPTVGSQRGTWRSGAASPAFPGANDADRLLRAVGRVPGTRGCTLVRVRLASRDEETLLDVRECLLGEEAIVGTSIGREFGPGAPGTFDIAVVPGSDPAAVGRAVAAVDDVVGVAATAFDSDPDAEGAGPDRADADRALGDSGTPTGGPADRSDDPGAPGLDDGGPTVEPILASIDESDGGDPGRSTPDDDFEGPDSSRVRDDDSEVHDDFEVRENDLAMRDGVPGVDDPDALQGGGNGTEPRADAVPPRSSAGTERSSNPARTNGGTPDARGDDAPVRRLEALEARVAALEARFDEVVGPARGRSDQPAGGSESLADRVASLEEAISDLERRERRTREVRDSPDESEPSG